MNFHTHGMVPVRRILHGRQQQQDQLHHLDVSERKDFDHRRPNDGPESTCGSILDGLERFRDSRSSLGLSG